MTNGFFHGIAIKLIALFSSLALLFGGASFAHKTAPHPKQNVASAVVATDDSSRREFASSLAPPAHRTSTSSLQSDPASPPVIKHVIVNQVFLPANQDEVNGKLAALKSDLLARIVQITTPVWSFSGPAQSTPVSFQTFAQSQKIDNLSGVTISNATVNGLSGLADADIPDTITASNYLPLTGGTLTGTLSVSNLQASSTSYSGNILSTLNTSAAPSSLGNWNSISTAFTGDLSHMGLGISRQTTGTSLGSPTTGYSLTRELSGIASYSYNSSGHNEQTSGNDGRTGALNFYAKNDNYGQGDSTSYFCDNFVASTRSGATSFLASPQVGCIGGQLFGGADGTFLQGVGDINFKDQGHDIAVAGLNFNFTRTNATGNINANWGAFTLQNQGALPIDWMLRATGPARVGVDLSALTFPDLTLIGITLSNGGTGYTAGDLLNPPDGTHDQQTVIKVLTVNGSGTVLTFAIDRAGLYSIAPASASSVSGGTGSGASFTLQYTTATTKPALVTKADNCWFANATQDTGVYNTSYSSTLKLGTSYVCFTSSLAAWNFVSNNSSVLQLYNNQVIANTTFKTTGNVGISTTTSPQSALVVSGGVSVGADYNTAAPTNGLIIEGKFGIGTTSPSTTFANSGSSYVVGGFGVGIVNTATGTVQTTGNITDGGVLAANGTSGTTTIASGQGLTVGDTQLVVQQGSGKVGIGTASPIGMMNLYGGSGNSQLYFSNSNTGANSGAYIGQLGGSDFYVVNSKNANLSFGTNNLSRVLINSSGSVGIATTSPWRTLSVTGTVGFDGLTGSTGAGSLCLDANRQVVYNSGSDACLSSLRSTKHDIADLSFDAITMVKALDPVSFVYNTGDGRTRYGFIAEDTAAVDAHLATYDASGTISGIDDRAIISIIVRALKDLITKLDALTATMAGFAQSFTSHFIHGDTVEADKLCVGSTCVTETQLDALLQMAGQHSESAAAANALSSHSDGSASTSSPITDALSTQTASTTQNSSSPVESDFSTTSSKLVDTPADEQTGSSTIEAR